MYVSMQSTCGYLVALSMSVGHEGCPAPTVQYVTLGVVIVFETRQLSSYMSLFQV